MTEVKEMKTIAVLGSTGSIGTQTLEVARANGDLKIAALAAGRNVKLLERQIREFSPRVVAVWEEEAAREFHTAGGGSTGNGYCGDDRYSSDSRSN